MSEIRKYYDRSWCYNTDDHQDCYWYNHKEMDIHEVHNPFSTFAEIQAHYAEQGITLVDGVPPWWMEDDVRRERNARLAEDCDTINPMRWDAMSDTEKQAQRDYRQALLDVPAQSDLYNVTWPTKP